ncbi:hypothetical protein AAHC03_024494 [Spirometra sp. Aus1]
MLAVNGSIAPNSPSKYDRLGELMTHYENINNQKGQLFASNQICISDALSAVLDSAIRTLFPELENFDVIITPSTSPKFGDYQCNSAFNLAKGGKYRLKRFQKKFTEVAASGFINIYISKEIVSDEISKLVRFGFTLPPPSRKLKIIVDMSSPNIAKEMHVGHLRSTIIGESVARLLAFLGHDILKLNHLGDWGTQFGMLIAHLHDTFKDLGDQPLPISDLQTFYKASKKRFDEDEAFKKRAYEAVVKLQAHDPLYLRDWNKICDISKREFNEIYRRMDIKDLIPRGESFYQSRMQNLITDLKSKNLLENDDGRQILRTPASQVPLIMVKSDGGFTYDTSDLTAIRQRIQEEGAERIIYVVDSGQGVHFDTVFSAAEKCGYLVPGRVTAEHVGFGLVLGEDKKKFKTRSGSTVKLVDLLNEGVERSLAKLKEKGRDKELTPEEQRLAAEAVAYGCIKYADLAHNRNNDYIFSFDKMLDDRGNTAAYLLYAYTRIRSIVRKTGWSPEKLDEVRRSAHLVLNQPAELKLGKILCRLPEVLYRLQTELLFHKLCEYVYEVSCAFTEFYDSCYCIEQDPKTGAILKIDESRILLCEATAIIMKSCFDILGLRTLEKM